MELIDHQVVPVDANYPIANPATTLIGQGGRLLLGYEGWVKGWVPCYFTLYSVNGVDFEDAGEIARVVHERAAMCGREEDPTFYYLSNGFPGGEMWIGQFKQGQVQSKYLAWKTGEPPTLAYFKGRIWLAWTDGGPKGVNTAGGLFIASAPWGTLDFEVGGATSLYEACCSQPSLAVAQDRLCIAWSGDPNRYLNLKFSSDGYNWVDKHTIETETGHPFILEDARKALILAWIGTDDERHINLIASLDQGATWSTKTVTPERAQGVLSLVNYNGNTSLAWSGFSDFHPNVASVTFDPKNVSISPSTIPCTEPVTIVVSVDDELNRPMIGQVVLGSTVIGNVGEVITTTIGGRWVVHRQVTIDHGQKYITYVREYVPNILYVRTPGHADRMVPITLTGIPAGDVEPDASLRTEVGPRPAQGWEPIA